MTAQSDRFRADIPAGGSGIAVTALNSGVYGPLRSPVVEVDGAAHPARWERTVVPVAAGAHHVVVYVPSVFGRRRGEAATVVVSATGQTTELEFCFPMWSFMAGSLGQPPQHHRGALSVLGFVAAMVLMLCVLLHLFPDSA